MISVSNDGGDILKVVYVCVYNTWLALRSLFNSSPRFRSISSWLRTWVSWALSSRTLAFRWASISCSVPELGGGFRVTKRSMRASTQGWPKEKTFFPGEKTMMAISAPQRVQSSLAFLKRPERRLEKVTWRLLSFGIFTISTFCLPLLFLMMMFGRKTKIFLRNLKKKTKDVLLLLFTRTIWVLLWVHIYTYIYIYTHIWIMGWWCVVRNKWIGCQRVLTNWFGVNKIPVLGYHTWSPFASYKWQLMLFYNSF